MAIFEPNDPRVNFSICPSPAARQLNASQTAAQGGLLNALGKIAGIEIDNKVFRGLRTLSKISDAVATTVGYDPFHGDGVDGVFGALGIGGGIINEINKINPQAVNLAIGQARSIASKIRQGNFNLDGIPGLLQDFRDLFKIGDGIINKRRALPAPCLDVASPYAVDYDFFFPKYKFLFACEFVFNPGYESFLPRSGQIPAFLIYKFERPTFHYESEILNLYNFRTTVLKNIVFEPITFEMHDDFKNQAFEFINTYIRWLTPITNLREPGLFEAQSMDFKKIRSYQPESDVISEQALSKLAGAYASSINPLTNDNKTIIQQMKVYHLYDWGRFMNVYTFYNPKFTEIQLDDLDMAESSSGSKITVTMNYDNVNIRANISVDPSAGGESIEDITGVGLFPLKYNDVKASLQTPSTSQGPPGILDSISAAAGETISKAQEVARTALSAIGF